MPIRFALVSDFCARYARTGRNSMDARTFWKWVAPKHWTLEQCVNSGKFPYPLHQHCGRQGYLLSYLDEYDRLLMRPIQIPSPGGRRGNIFTRALSKI